MSSSKQAASVVPEGWLGACLLSSALGDAELMAVHLQMSSGLDTDMEERSWGKEGLRRGPLRGRGEPKQQSGDPNCSLNKGQWRSRRKCDINYVEKNVYKINVFIKNYAVR